MNKIIIKIILAIAIGVLVGTITGNLESNKTVTYFALLSSGDSVEISKDAYVISKKQETDKRYLNKKVAFNKELGFYYGAITSSSLVIFLLITSLMKKQEDQVSS